MSSVRDTSKPEKFILDATAGFRMMRFNKNDPNTVYMDSRTEVKPDVVCDFANLSQFSDESFYLIVFDPPHMLRPKGNMASGNLVHSFGAIKTRSWRVDFFKAFREFRRLLRPYGILIFKWNDHDVETRKVLAMTDGWTPLFGQKTVEKTKHSSKTLWFCFMKKPKEKLVSQKQL